MKLATTALAAFLLALALASCGGDSGSAEGTNPAALESSAWVLSDGIEVAGWEQAAPTVRFERGQLSGSSGCNTYGGKYEVNGSDLSVSEIFSTLIGCPPPAGGVEEEFMASLEDASEWQIEDRELVLSGGEDELRFRAASPEGSWRATSVLQDNAVKTLLAGSEITANFGETGVSGSGGCNEYDAGYRAKGSSITIELLGATEMACESPAGVMEQEAAYLEALPRAAEFRIENGSLMLLTAKGTVLASFEPAGEEG